MVCVGMIEALIDEIHKRYYAQDKMRYSSQAY